MAWQRVTLFSSYNTSTQNYQLKLNCDLPYNEKGYQLAVESFTTASKPGPFCMSANGIFAQTSFDNSVNGERTNLLLGGETHSIVKTITSNTLGHKLIPSLKNQQLNITVYDANENLYVGFPNFILSVIIYEII